MQLRDYQNEAVQSVFDGWNAGIPGNYLISMPTGSGKSLVVAALTDKLHHQYKAKILVLTHVMELIEQNIQKLVTLSPGTNYGVFSAGLNRKELHHDVVFASIQSISGHIHKRDRFDIVIIDEVHTVSDDGNSRYRKTLATLKMMNPNMRVIGLTATPYRMTTGWLHKGDDAMFDCIIHEVSLLKLISDGYLCNIVTKSGAVHINTNGVAKRGGEFVSGELETAAMTGDVTESAVCDMVARASDRKKWIVFACGIDHAKQITDALISHGITAKMVTGDTPKAERADIIKEHKAGALRALVNVNCLTTGFDNPAIDMIACLRPTGSPGLWVQMIGRGFRMHPDKKDCLVLDYTSNSINFGPIDKINPKEKSGDSDGIAPSKECPECTCIIPAQSRVCSYCGYEFLEAEIKIEHRATEAPILSTMIEPEGRKVENTWFSVHSKPGKDACVKIEYQCGFDTYYDWVFPKSKFRSAYIKTCKEWKIEPFDNAHDWVAYANGKNLEGPVNIWTVPDGKYTKVVRREFVPF